MVARKTQEQFEQEVRNLVGTDFSVLGDYINTETKIKMKHNICGHEFDMKPNNFLNGQRCPKCGREAAAKKRMLTQKEFEKRVYDMYEDEYSVLGQYKGHRHHIKMRHNKCGHEWEPTANNFLRWRGCPECASSTGERRIASYLRNNGYKYETEFRFPELAVKQPLRYDFVVFVEELPVLIEYDGIGHFQAVGVFTKESVAETQKRDVIKSNFAKENGIPLIRIGYKDFNKIEEILAEELNKICMNYEDYQGYVSDIDLSGVGTIKKGSKLTIDDVEKIGDLLRKTDLTHDQIGQQFKVTRGTIGEINTGKSWNRPGVDYPIREQIDYSQTIDKDELIKDIATIGFKATGEKHGYSGNGVKHWCEQLGLPTDILSIQKLYGVVPQIKMYNKTEEYFFEDLGQCVDFIKENGLTKAGHNAIRSSLRRVVRGERNSYLGYRIEELQN